MFKGGFRTRLLPRETLIDLAPLVDVVFLLLIFFFVTSEILPLKSLPLEPPLLSLEAPNLPADIVIAMDRYGLIYVGSHQRATTLSQLPELLKEQLPTKAVSERLPSLVLSVDREIPYGMFLQLFSTLYQTGYPIRLVFENVS